MYSNPIGGRVRAPRSMRLDEKGDNHMRRLPWGALLVPLMLLASMSVLPSAQATYPGHNGRIAFGDFVTGQIYSINADGSGFAQLTNSNGVSAQPNWSLDGTKIVFTSDRSGETRIWIMNADGTDQHRLARDLRGYRDYQPTFAPGGKRIVFSRCLPDDGVCAIYDMKRDGTDKRALTTFKDGTNEAVDFDPLVAPNGKRIAFTRFSAGGTFSQVYVMRRNGRRAHPVTPARLEASSPDWSPGGRKISFNTNCCRAHSAIFQIDARGTDPRRLTDPVFPHNDVSPSYSPTGNRIAFASDRRREQFTLGLFVMQRDGSGIKPLFTGLNGVVDVSWGPAASATAALKTSPPPVNTTSARARKAALSTWCAFQPRMVGAVECKTLSTAKR
jgi:Tol biopolymer transport system component